MKKINNKGFSIVLAMGMSLVLSGIVLMLLEYIIPFGRNVKGVENSSAAFYNSYIGVEESLWELNQNHIGYGSTSPLPTTATGSSFTLESMTSVIPPEGKGNSEYDSDWNIIDANHPIQLSLSSDANGTKINAVNFNQTEFQFRVPVIDGATGTLTGAPDTPYIQWILSGLNGADAVVLNGNLTELITQADIDGDIFHIGLLQGTDSSGNTCRLNEFFRKTCVTTIPPLTDIGIESKPTLKLSVINELLLTDGRNIPYLEYRIVFKQDAATEIEVPGRYSQISTSGKSYGYKKSMEFKIPQLSTNQAFDFAVFQ
ncbi:MAG: hypothetical protein GY828_04955 [Candidatus Gracilibacteria bacterium]|nr:hypothetical protein [Candidatus Gracilibacteria bacterium]